MKRIIKNKFIYIFISILLTSLFFMNKGYSSEIEDVELVECNKSSAYLAWEKLTPEEQEKIPMPTNNQQYYNFTFDVKGNLPSSYTNKNTKVKDQKSTGQCWAFSTTTILESYIKKQDNLTYAFSPRHIEYSSTRSFLNGAINDYGYNRSLGSGGHFYMSSNYLINGYGPIAESEMPFQDNENAINISQIQNKTTLVDVNNIVLSYNEVGKKCSAAQIQNIKELIYKNGAVATTTYLTTSSKYYNSTNAAYYYNGSYNINHAITLVGWDDNYDKNNFSSTTRPTANGAWIVQNSYGTSYGKNGYYYLSYEDVHICDFYMAIDELDYEVEDNSYILDKLGYISFLGYASTNGTTQYKTGYAMNVFTKSNKQESLREVTFGSNGTGNYKIYYMPGKATKTTKISSMTEIGSGRIEYAGYITHKLDTPILIDASVKEFSIAVYYEMDTSTKPLPISTASAPKYEYVSTISGVSFVSLNGESWSDLAERTYDSIASIKAFTNNVEFSLEIGTATITYPNNAVLNIKTKASNIDTTKLEIYIKDNNNNTVTPLKVNYTNGSSLSQITIELSRPNTNNKYSVMIYYKDQFIDSFTIDIAGTTNITSTTYTINQTKKIIYTLPKTNVTTFTNNINNEQGNVYNNTTKVTTGYIATGMTIDNYTIIVKGDVSGDGEITPLDYINVKNHIMNTNKITNSAFINSADYNNDNEISPLDYVEIKNYIMNGG